MWTSVRKLFPSIVLLALLAASGGCRSASVVEVGDATVLPETWQGRRPFRSADATIYAHDADEADETGELAAEVAADFRRLSGREPSPRVLLISGSRDWLPDAELCERLRLAVAGRARLAGEAEPTAEQQQVECERMLEESAEVGIDPRTMLVLVPDTLEVRALSGELALPAAAGGAFDWAIVVATRDELSSAVRTMLDAAMAKEKPSLAERMLIAPLMPWIRGKTIDTVRGGTRRALFAAHAAAQADWTADERKRRLEEYAEELGAALDRNVPPQATGQPPQD